MITFHSQQSDCARRTRKNENTGTFNLTSQIAPSICTVVFTKCEKSHVTIFTSRCSRTSLFCIFRQGHALLLSQAKVLRLANGSSKLVRSPAKWARDIRDTTDKTSGEMPRVIAAQCPHNGRATANAMSPDDWRDNSQSSAQPSGSDNVTVRATDNATSCETSRKTTRRSFAITF
jgi:hypothetical protein